MNTELLIQVAEHIEALPESFDLSVWAMPAAGHHAADVNVCDTVGCVAGWAVMLSDPKVRAIVPRGERYINRYPWGVKAGSYLDLTVRQADILFSNGTWWGTQMEKYGFEPRDGWDPWDEPYCALDAVPPKAAAHILRELAAGEIGFDGEWDD